MAAPFSPEQQKRMRPVVAVVMTLIIGVFLVQTYNGRWSPAAREAHAFLRALPTERILDIHLEPYQVLPLVSREVVISDRDDIERIASLLRGASEISLNHPSARWVGILRIRTAAGDYGGQVEATTNHGVVVIYASDVQSGFNYGAVRADALGPVLEALATAAGAQP